MPYGLQGGRAVTQIGERLRGGGQNTERSELFCPPPRGRGAAPVWWSRAVSEQQTHAAARRAVRRAAPATRKEPDAPPASRAATGLVVARGRNERATNARASDTGG